MVTNQIIYQIFSTPQAHTHVLTIVFLHTIKPSSLSVAEPPSHQLLSNHWWSLLLNYLVSWTVD